MPRIKPARNEDTDEGRLHARTSRIGAAVAPLANRGEFAAYL